MPTTVFLSSTARDLADYREAARAAIEGLDGYSCIRMETFGARAWSAAEFCRTKVGECDLFIGILGHLHGSGPPGSEKSYTELEYEAAVDYEKTYLMFLASDELEVPMNLIREEYNKDPGKQDRQQAFHKRVADSRICGFFNSPEDLAGQIQQAIYNNDRGKEEPSEPNMGYLVPYTCDRTNQEADFRKHFASGLSTHPGVPQVYLIHGEERESHGSLIERFRSTRIQEHAQHKWGEHKATVSVWDTEWPDLDELHLRQDRLIAWLFEKIDPLSPVKQDYDYSPAAFASLLGASLNSIVIIQHEISAKTWDQTTVELIEWYLNFWNEVKAAASIPQCLVFLNIIYPHTQEHSGWFSVATVERLLQKRKNSKIQQQLRGICQSNQLSEAAAPRCPLVMLNELTCVTPADVMRWFRRHKIGRDDGEREQKCKEIFIAENGEVSDCKNMRDVEHALNKLHQTSVRRSVET
jgi:hypothetical protein